MVNMRNNHFNGQANNANNNNPQMEQLLATQNQLMQAVLQTLNQLQLNPQAQQQHQPPPPPPQSRLGELLRTHPTAFSQAKDPMEDED
jgi:predicted XRE-type DNA-binding protein